MYPIAHNYLAADNGCRVLEASSQRQGSPAANILTANQREVWIVQEKLPQFCTIDTSGMKSYPQVFNRVGFYCWHEYQSNPAVIEVCYRNGMNGEWIVAAKVRLELKSQYQSFNIKDIAAAQMKQLKVTLLQNYGDHSTYLNHIQLGYCNQPNHMRQRSVSQFSKLTFSERQVRKAQQELKRLSTENQWIKKTLKTQQQLILQMQTALSRVNRQLSNLRQIQPQSKQQMHPPIPSHNQPTDKPSQTQRQGHHNYALPLQNSSQNQTVQSTASNQLYSKSERNSSTKYEERYLNRNRIRHWKQQGSESQLSEYLVSQGQDESKYSQKCSQMMAKLQALLAERQKRNRQLRHKKA